MKLTGDDAIFGCDGNVGAGVWELDDEESFQWGVLSLVKQCSGQTADAASQPLNGDVHVVDGVT